MQRPMMTQPASACLMSWLEHPHSGEACMPEFGFPHISAMGPLTNEGFLQIKASDEHVQGASQGIERARAEVREKEECRHVLHHAITVKMHISLSLGGAICFPVWA